MDSSCAGHEQSHLPGVGDVLGSSCLLLLRSLALQGTRGSSYGVVATAVQLKGLNLDVMPRPQGGEKGGC